MRKMTIRVTEEQYQALLKAAKDLGKGSAASIVRQLVSTKFGIATFPKDVRTFRFKGYGTDKMVAVNIPLHVLSGALALLAEDKWIHAIKHLRDYTPIGLYEAKMIVDVLRGRAEEEAAPPATSGHLEINIGLTNIQVSKDVVA